MAFGGFNDNQNQAPMADINITPMVDVMLVLLVIFIITAPLFTHAIKVDLPSAQSAPAPEKPETISLSIDRSGKMFWNDAPVAESELTDRLIAAAARQPQPELQLRADKDTRYEILAQVMSLAQNNGLNKIGFVTVPGKNGATK
ncbi:biopolymer transporter ExbD [Collimonas sp.]|jgi:biopolymer transport protein ExbD|uniref:ExbD/TolR family protein n=1 Tax=Collimonas sp. TaxID=1963772 RepID=UPI002BF39281|nr:biopolymer transporter ExbD [Collimonas sp.]HWW03821.1 biopolymer transporter ExbD [Collimonas sp.]